MSEFNNEDNCICINQDGDLYIEMWRKDTHGLEVGSFLTIEKNNAIKLLERLLEQLKDK